MTFEELRLHPNILKGIKDLGYIRPTPIQEQAIPHILAGKDVIASAQTGTGKTAAFVLPILHRLLSIEPSKKGVRCLIVAPTRELALQSTEHLQNLARHVHLRGAAIFGGVPEGPQVKALAAGVELLSATPGRLLDHVYQGRIDFGALEILVLDEADRMMDMGFLPDVQKIISLLPPKRQNLIFSATIPQDIFKLAQAMCHEPVRVAVAKITSTPVGINHAVYPVPHLQKTELLLRLLHKEEAMNSVLVFTRTKHRADRLAQQLERAAIRTSVLHSNRSQNQRLAALEKFREGRSQVMVATDIAARGIDIKDISHVINFDVPQSPEDYIHRIGRTGRVEATGDAFSLIAPDEESMMREIEKALDKALPRVILPDFNYQKGHGQAQGRPRHQSGGGPSARHQGPGGQAQQRRGPRPQHQQQQRHQQQRPHPQQQQQSPQPHQPQPPQAPPQQQHQQQRRQRPQRPQRRGQQQQPQRQPDPQRPPREKYVPGQGEYELDDAPRPGEYGEVTRGPAPEPFFSSSRPVRRGRGRRRR